MFIKQQLLVSAYPLTLLLVLLCFINNPLLYLCVALCFIIYSLIRYQWVASFIFVLAIVYCYPFNNVNDASSLTNQVCYVEAIKTNSSLIKCAKYRYYLSDDYEVVIGDKLIVDGPVKQMDRPSTFFGFDQQAYNNAYHISGFIGKASVTKIGTTFNTQRYFQRFVENTFDNGKALMQLFWMNSSSSTVLIFSGFIYITLIQLMVRLFSLFVDEKKIQWIEIGLIIGVGLCVGFDFLFIRHLLKHGLRNLNLDKDIKFSITVLCWIWIRHGYINTLSFVYPFMYYWLSLLNNQLNYWDKITINFFIQGIYLNHCSLLSLIGFNCVKGLSTLLFTFELMSVMSDSTIDLSCINSFESKLLIDSNPIGFGLILYFLIVTILKRWIKPIGIVKCALYLWFAFSGNFHPLPSITFINVGQGDSILVKSSFNRTSLLIDTGKANAYDDIRTLLKGYGVHQLDGLLITHSDADHSDNMESIVADYHVDTLVTQDFDSMKIGDIPITNCNHYKDQQDPNASSLALLLNCNGITFMLPGDIPDFVEEMIVRTNDIGVDILKASHHGSKTGSSDLFLDTLQPKMIIYSAGTPSIYNHPHPSVIQKAKKRHILQLNTYLHGDITFAMLGPYCIVISSSGLIGWYHK